MKKRDWQLVIFCCKIYYPATDLSGLMLITVSPFPVVTSIVTNKMTDLGVVVECWLYWYKVIGYSLQWSRRWHFRITTSYNDLMCL